MTKRLLFLLALSMFAASGCNLIYKQNIQQGNAIQQEDLDKLRLGMSMNQVSFLLGTPAIQDPFHHDRWDYVSSFSRRGEEAVMRKVALHFENGVLVEMIGVEGDEFIFEDEPEDEAEDETGATATVADGRSLDAAPDAAEVTPLETPAAEQAEFESEAAEPGPTAVEPESAALAEDAEPEATQVASAKPAAPAGWVIQLGAFDSRENATQMRDRLIESGFAAEIQTQMSATGERYLVRQRGIETRAAAEGLLQDIRDELGINGFLVPRTD